MGIFLVHILGVLDNFHYFIFWIEKKNEGKEIEYRVMMRKWGSLHTKLTNKNVGSQKNVFICRFITQLELFMIFFRKILFADINCLSNYLQI